ncbi:MAG: hypothetical protein GY950_18990 [bacterium]|nr:hypothetical protein [bacterium]
MPIREKGYYNWEGQLKTSPAQWMPIFLTGIKTVYKKKWSKLLFILSGGTFLLFLLAVYVATKPELRMMRPLVRMIQTDAGLFNVFYTNGYLLFMLILLSIFAGGELISGDLKFKSFTLYLSRPLTPLDYVKGKFSIVLFYLLAFTLVPGLLLIFFKTLFTGTFTVPFTVLLSGIFFPVWMALFLSSLIILLSSLSANARMVKVLFFIIYLMSTAVAQIFKKIFNSRSFEHISIGRNINHFSEYIFGTGAGPASRGLIAGGILLALTVIFFMIVLTRIKRVEV